MASSDDEAETLPETVSTYYFEDHDDEPVSFSVLPVRWSDGDGGEDDAAETIFLHGTADNGLRKIYREVKSWRFDLGRSRPEVSVLSKDNICFKLDKPRRSFQDTIRTVLITLHCLHYAKNHPDASREALWEHLAKTLGFYEVRPSARDLQDHVALIKEAIRRDDALAKSKVLSKLMEEKPRKRSKSAENVANPSFIVDDTEDVGMEDVEDGTAEEDDCFDSVCALCDNGGNLLCCDGKCMRSFHATEEAGEESLCDSLGFSQHEVDAMPTYKCENCIHNLHQCFACGKLGSSDKSAGADVFQCVSATCGLFYHPHCVAKLVHRRDEVAAEELKLRIAAGKSFTCPMHKCCVCNQIENKKEHDLQFAVCRRCPKSYHRKCLPKEIVFEDEDEDEDEDAITRAWEGLLPNRVLIYCLKHDIDEEIGTPVRNHIKFPTVTIRANRAAVGEKRKRPVLGSLSTRGQGLKKKRVASEDSSKRASEKKSLGKGKSPFTKKEGEKDKKVVSSGQDIAKKVKATGVSKKFHKDIAKSRSLEPSTSFIMREHTSLGERLCSFTTKASQQIKPGEAVVPDSEERRAVQPASEESDDSLHALDADTERRLLNLMKEAASSISMGDVVRKQKVPSTHAQYLKSTVDKAITIGKVEGSVQALRAALQRLEEGGSNEDAKAVCDPDVVTQIFKWKDKLRVYLAPFIYGMRYTSFGRHFTKVDKLQEVVDKLHWYARDGDMIVDFCCGANDFSCLMAKKLEETGKKCSYKNYDIFPPKNNFEFELRDWMTVQLKELPYGSKLIMGLNPPFGVKAALANKFIDKALEFKPKLLMLIVPSETERLDEKKFRYDLVWEDDRFLSGKSFYLPGSVDVKDKQIEQWNNTPPLLYLWSRRDWTATHWTIAQKQGHLPTNYRRPLSNDDCNVSLDLHYLKDDRSSSLTSDTSIPMGRPEETKDRVNMAEGPKGCFPGNDSGRESWESQSTGTSTGKANGIGTSGGEIHGKSPAKGTPHHPSPKLTDGKLSFYNQSSREKADGSRTHGREIDEKVPRCPSPNLMNAESSFSDRSSREKAGGRGTRGREIDEEPPAKETSRRHSPKSSVNDQPSRSHGVPFENDVGGMNYQQADPSMSMSHAEDFYGGRGSTLSGDANRMYGLNNNKYCSTQRWSSGGGPLTNSRAQNLEGPHRARMRGPGYYRPNVSEREERYRRDLDMRSQVRLYGQQDPNMCQRNYMAGHDPGYGQSRALTSTYGLLGSITESSQRMDMSAMQRYAPRLDELNPMRMNNAGPEAPLIRGNGYLDPNRGPQSGNGGSSFGFATGPRRPYSQQNTFGWLNE